MPRFLRLKNVMVHVPSLSSISIQSTWFGRPSLSLYFHNSKENKRISYSQWETCETDFNKVKVALTEVESYLSQIPLTEVKEVKEESPKVEEEKKE